jgi:hypothetical protein
MIVYDLKCDAGHLFEAWFRDSAAYDKLHAQHKVTCADCGSTKVERQLCAPAINTRGEAPPRDAPEHVRKAMTMLRELRAEVEKTSEYVGERFPDEARAIHHGDAERRNIYGEATREEAEALSDEGIEVAAIPWVPKSDA